MQNISTVTERSFAKAWGISSTLILPRSSMWKSVKKSKHLRRLMYVTRFTKIEHTKQLSNLSLRLGVFRQA